MSYKQLDFRRRCQIYGLWRAGYNQVEIAREVGVHKSTISRELNRNITFVRTKLGSWQYKPNYAQGNADERHKKKHKQKGGKLYLYLRHQNKKYRKRYGSPKRQEPINNRRFIDDRPEIVSKKNRIGDWEIDTIIGKQRKQAVVSVVERLSKKTILKKVKVKTAEQVTAATISGLKSYSDTVFTITADNGSEFAYHEKISKELNTEFYFAHPYSSWERGLNENTNGLVRQYLKKGADFKEVTDDYLAIIADQLNNRPRKSLGYATPNEIFST